MYQLIFDFRITSRQNATQTHTPVLSPNSHTLGAVNKFKTSSSSNYSSEAKLTFYTFLLTYLLTPWSRVLLQKLKGSAASQEIPCIFGTRKFITVVTSARHLSLS